MRNNRTVSHNCINPLIYLLFSPLVVFRGEAGGVHSPGCILWGLFLLQIIPWWRRAQTVSNIKTGYWFDICSSLFWWICLHVCCSFRCICGNSHTPSVCGPGHGRKGFCIACLFYYDMFTRLHACAPVAWCCCVSKGPNCSLRGTDKQIIHTLLPLSLVCSYAEELLQ